MSNPPNRPNRPDRQIRGPHSALTDFLAASNISARQIRADADARRQAATANGNHAEGSAPASNSRADTESDPDDQNGGAGPSTAVARAAAAKKRKTQVAIEKIKKSKAYKKRKRAADDSDSDDLAEALFNEKSKPMPGQMENCAICDKRFTVTPYSPAGPDAGLLCTKCAKEHLKKNDKDVKKKKKAPSRIPANRRNLQSRILDGTYNLGAKSLVTLCIERLAKNVDLAEDLGGLPTVVIDRIARNFSKMRLVNTNTLNLFLQPETTEVKVYDAANLVSDDFIRIFQLVPKLEDLKLRNAIQFQDGVMDYLTSRNLKLKSLYLHGANLLSPGKWQDFLRAKGDSLEALQVYYTASSITDDVVSSLHARCPSLKRLKIAHNQELTDVGLKSIANLKSLQHLGLHFVHPKPTEAYVEIVENVGQGLRTLSLRDMIDVDDRLLDAIHGKCRSLTKLRITNSEAFTDAGFVRLFKDWANPGLLFADFEKCRHVDSIHPRENAHMIGLCDDGFYALMSHSGQSLLTLNLHACRHITADAFHEVFSEDKEYTSLVKIEVSFCEEVTDTVVGCIFRSCPNLRELNVFGCMKVRDVRVPKGKILVGVPNAMGMMIEGTDE